MTEKVIRIKSCLYCPYSKFTFIYGEDNRPSKLFYCTRYERFDEFNDKLLDANNPDVIPDWCPL